MLGKISCSLGHHRFTTWSPPREFFSEYSGHERCTEIRTCERCGLEEVRTLNDAHSWNEPEYLANDPCRQMKKCKNCGVIQNVEPSHEFGNWKYITDNSCVEVKVCTRCGTTQESTIPNHEFGDWKYIANSSCTQVKVCSRCGFTEKRSFGVGREHQFGDWEFVSDGDSCKLVRICTQCGFTEVGIQADHEFGEWKYIGTTCEQSAKCSVCGFEGRRVNHNLVFRYEYEKMYRDDEGGDTGYVFECTRCNGTFHKNSREHFWAKT